MNDTEGIKLDYEAIGKILKSDDMMMLCLSYAEKYQQDGQYIKSFVGFDRCHAHVYDEKEEQ